MGVPSTKALPFCLGGKIFMRKRLISLLLVVISLLGMFPAVLAATASTEEEALGTIDIYNGGYTLAYLAINGRVQREQAASVGCLINIMTTTDTMVRKSGISVVTLLDNTSFREFTSPMIRASIFPVGRLSKK